MNRDPGERSPGRASVYSSAVTSGRRSDDPEASGRILFAAALAAGALLRLVLLGQPDLFGADEGRWAIGAQNLVAGGTSQLLGLSATPLGPSGGTPILFPWVLSITERTHGKRIGVPPEGPSGVAERPSSWLVPPATRFCAPIAQRPSSAPKRSGCPSSTSLRRAPAASAAAKRIRPDASGSSEEGPDVTAGEYTEAPPRRPRAHTEETMTCLLYTSPSPRDGLLSRMPSSA